MRLRRLLALILVVTVLVTFVQPARAEALEPTLIVLIVSAGIVVVTLIAFLIIANVTEYQRGTRPRVEDGPVLVVWHGPLPVESP